MRVLLVEDESRIADFIAKGLRQQSYAVDIVYDGSNALFQISVNDYDLIILDVMLPNIDGFQVCHQLRTEGSQIPILMLTARDAVADKITGLEMGADDYLTKPFEFGELLARVRALLRRGKRVYQTKINIADLTVDIQSQRVWRGKTEISLTTKEYALLEYLARNAGRIVSRAEIAEHVWDEAFDVFSNIIEVYINRLRYKIDEKFEVSLIHTRRGVGYVLAALDDVEKPT